MRSATGSSTPISECVKRSISLEGGQEIGSDLDGELYRSAVRQLAQLQINHVNLPFRATARGCGDTPRPTWCRAPCRRQLVDRRGPYRIGWNLRREPAARSAVAVSVLSRRPIAELARTDAPTWLDRELIAGSGLPARDVGFGREVRDALAVRRQWLVDHQLAPLGSSPPRPGANLLDELRTGARKCRVAPVWRAWQTLHAGACRRPHRGQHRSPAGSRERELRGRRALA